MVMRVFGIVTSLVAIACTQSSAPADAGPSDTGVDTAIADVATEPKPPDPVVVCKAEATRVAALCKGDAQKKCFFEKYADLCTLERNDIITKALGCFNLPACHTFSDPSDPGIEACIRMVSTNASNAGSVAARDAYCAKCATSAPCMGQTPFLIPFEHLSDARNAQTTMCADAAADCMGADACIAVEFADLDACLKQNDN
jgi:hypothetical protein